MDATSRRPNTLARGRWRPLLIVAFLTGAVERFVSIGFADAAIPVIAGGALWFSDEAGHRILRVNVADLSG
jgi:hypothetical protein